MADNYVPVDDVLQTIIQATMDDTGWIEAIGTLGNPVQYRRKNGYVFFQTTTGSSNLTQNAYKTVFTLPEGFRPSGVSTVKLACDSGGSPTRPIVAYVQASGEVQVYSNENSKYFNAFGTFPVG